MTLRILSYNIRYGGTGREDALAAVINAAAPDVVMLQEASDPRVVATLAAATGMPHSGAQPGNSTGFLSRVPVASHAWHHPATSRHAFLEVELADGAGRLFGLHLSAWFSKWSERRRAREIRALLDGIKRAPGRLPRDRRRLQRAGAGRAPGAARLPARGSRR